MKKHIFILVIAIVLFMVGVYQHMQYEENRLVVNATITDIQTIDRTDDGPVTFAHTYYGTYTANGNQYANKELITKRTGSPIPALHIGDTMEIEVDPNNPSNKITDGRFCGVIGCLLIVYSAIMLSKDKKRNRNEKRAEK